MENLKLTLLGVNNRIINLRHLNETYEDSIGIFGSIRVGNTDWMANRLLDSAETNGAHVHRIFLRDFDHIEWCRGCNLCHTNGGKCIIDYDMQKIYPRLLEAARAPTIEEVAKEYGGKVFVGKLDVDENPKTAECFQVYSIPTMVIMKNGQEVDRIVGCVQKKIIVAALEKHLG